ncbi:AAA family ATPase [Brytella acorum]|uniref:Chromosome partition protein Smc n=1 Tax=Brytella acorum TaxID=2959299 RepID=A0AA35VAF7_9PROT|nr:AAA family ATPase [Brytella acorum]MDF3624196.1 AAA family ATPase [Brytella acorum]CAI9120702.1 AAA family ATPase [Brytella acorum]
MTAKITRLRIAGFKSFADAATVEILPGLTGVVGPNGCGKSNVVEAMRWAMGESSARALRGGELDDLIFAGTSARPARNQAEVTLWLEDARGLAPGPFTDAEELEITRKAERGAGSDFRLNGRSVRARDVTTMFADLSSGARSSSIISQNRVGTLINAKPDERRALLEEAAGISGLHARRHDAELKLRQTEANLARSEDLRLQIEQRLETLGEQTLQARRYRAIAENLRDDEATLQALLHARAHHVITQTEEALATARSILAEAQERAAAEETQEQQFQARLPAAQATSDAARARLERLRVLVETATLAEAEAARTLEAALTRSGEGEADARAAEARLAETEAALRADIAEGDRLEHAAAALPQRLASAQHERETAEQTLQERQARLQNANEALVEARIEADSRRQALQAAQIQHDSLLAEVGALEAELDGLRAELPAEDALRELTREETTLTASRAATAAALERAIQARQDAELHAERADHTRAEVEKQGADHAAEQARLKTQLDDLKTQIAEFERQHAAAAASLESEDARAAFATGEQDAFEAAKRAEAAEEAARTDSGKADAEKLASAAARQELAQRSVIARREHETALTAFKRLEAHASQATRDCDAAGNGLVTEARLIEAREGARLAEDALRILDQKIGEHESRLAGSRQSRDAAAAAVQEAEAELLRLRARRDGLAPNADAEADPLHPSVIDLLDIPETWSRAVAAALADGLDASLGEDPSLSHSWRALPPSPSTDLPPSAIPLSSLVTAPPALSRALEAVGVIDDPQAGPALQTRLARGLALVTRDGALWRWDGYRVSGGRPSHAAQKLERRHALIRLDRLLAETEAALTPLQATAGQAAEALTRIEDALAALRRDRHPTEQKATQARRHEATLDAQATAANAAMQIALRERDATQAALAEARQRLDDASSALRALPDSETAEREERVTRDRAQEAHLALTVATQARIQATRVLETVRETRRQSSLRHEAATNRIETLVPALAHTRREFEQAEQRQQDRNRLAAALDPLKARQAQEEAHAARERARQQVETLRLALQADESRLGDLVVRHRQLSERRVSLLGREAVLLPRLEAQIRARDAAREKRDRLPEVTNVDDLEMVALAAQGATDSARGALDEARTSQMLLEAENTRVVEAIARIKPRIEAGAARGESLRRERDEALRRLGLFQAALREAESEPERLRIAMEKQQEALADAETAVTEAEAAFMTLENSTREAASRKTAEHKRAVAAREDEIRLAERLEQGRAARDALLAAGPAPDIAPPEDVSEQAESGLRRRLSRLARERDALGPVNLRAEQEHDEARAQSDLLAREHEDLQEAINRLRGSIGHLNREGREKLQAVFAEVDRNFQTLFGRMFSGGRAHLALVGSDDPLEAGLEIYAQPPGKKLSTLSLLSGGEQALTALSLVFATFRCQPAPICVLDEVDAPLDDANVERLCGLVRDMASEAGTRFLVVTHHQLTMAHMDRLFGVTMQERGVSRVLSVDLSSATAFADKMPEDSVS